MWTFRSLARATNMPGLPAKIGRHTALDGVSHLRRFAARFQK
jgi:hypothetical protein